MDTNTDLGITIDDYRQKEAFFHKELMDVCRRYINDLSIVSLVGIIDIVKGETIELEKATKHQDVKKPSEPFNVEQNQANEFNRF